MKKRILLLTIIIFSLSYGYSQEKQNEIFFVEYIQGVSIYQSEGSPTLGGELNYQSNQDIFSFRFINNDYEFREVGLIGFGQPIVSEITNEKINEFSFLYGKRYIRKKHSYSISVGVSYNAYQTDFTKVIDGTITIMTNESRKYIGIPYELNIKWFKKSNSRYRVLELIPIGKKTSIGNSIGFKIFGNISKNNLIGFGLTLGIGTHKIYME